MSVVPENDANKNAWAARLIGECFQQAGIAAAVLCPGNRNVPLLFALQKIFHDSYYVHLDERSAAFMALGLAKQLQKPVLVNMTSGSALANVLPALCEAHAAHIPLIILSADRPDYLHHSGAPQCMQQQHIFKDFVSHSLHFDFTNADVGSLHLALMQINNALEACLSTAAAPIHINIAFDDPLPPLPDPNWQSPTDPRLDPDKNPFPEFELLHSKHISDHIRLAVQGNKRGLIICGPDAPIKKADLIALARSTGFPVLADAASNLRHADIPQLISSADLLLLGALAAQPADLLIRIGAAPLSRTVYEYCAKQSCPVIRIDNTEIRKDFLHRQFLMLCLPSSDCLAELADACTTVDKAWQEKWLHADKQAQALLTQYLSTSAWGECSAAAAICTQIDFSILQCANSMAIRHANVFCRPSTTQIISHRGVNGIDGSIGSFLGACIASKKTSLLLCGDIAFLHDLPALSAAKYIQSAACIVILNNQGGHIFDLLPAANCAGFEELMNTPQDVDYQAIAQGFKIPFTRCDSMAALTSTLSTHSRNNSCSIIEVNVPAHSLKTQWAALKALFSA